MKFTERLKKDKGYRIKAILIFIAAVMLIGSIPDSKKEARQSQCNNANIGGTQLPDGSTFCGWPSDIKAELGGDLCMDIFQIGPTQKALELCTQNLCEVGRYSKESSIDLYGCFDCVPVGARATRASLCCSGVAETLEKGGTYDKLCISSGGDDPNKPDPSSACSNEFQKTLAGMVDSVEFFDGNSCKTNYYLVVFGGGAIFLIFILAAL